MSGSGAPATEMEVTLFFTMSGLSIFRKGGAEKVVLPGAPESLPRFIEIVQDGCAKMIARSAAFPIVGMNQEDLIEGVQCGGVTVLAHLYLTASERDHLVSRCNLLADGQRRAWHYAFDEVAGIHLSSLDTGDAAENPATTGEEVR